MYCPFWSVRFRNIKHTHITVQPSPPYVWLMKLSPIKHLPPLSFRSWWPLGFLPPWLWPNLPECIHLSHQFSVFMRLIGNLTQGEASSLCPFFPCPFPVTCSGGLSVLWRDGYLPLQHWLRFQSTHLLHFVHSFVHLWVTYTLGHCEQRSCGCKDAWKVAFRSIGCVTGNGVAVSWEIRW